MKPVGSKSVQIGLLSAPLDLTPEEFYDEQPSDIRVRPIKRLMLAVLEDALNCLDKHANAKHGDCLRIYREAEQWFCRNDDDSIFSFSTVCETLGIEPNYLRSGLREMARRAISRPQRNPLRTTLSCRSRRFDVN